MAASNQIDPKEIIKLELSLQDVQIIINALVEQPYKLVAELLNKLKFGVDAQIKTIIEKKSNIE